MPGHRVEAVDATGAGDTFDGAFLARLLAGDDLRDGGALRQCRGGAVDPGLRRGDAYSAGGRSPG